MHSDQYTQCMCQEHLYNRCTFTYLTPDVATRKIEVLKSNLEAWLKHFKSSLSAMEIKFICTNSKNNKDPFSYFYIMLKVHKSPWITRPITSYSGSLLQPLGVWVDKYLQFIAKDIPTYIQDPKSLKEELCSLLLPLGARLFIVNATNMYTDIHIRAVLNVIGPYFHCYKEQYPNVPICVLYKGLELIILHNIFKFGDSHWQQKKGTAMCTQPAPSYATLFFGIHEIDILC